MADVKIGDVVTLVAPSGATRQVTVADVIRDCFDRTNVLALTFQGNDGPVTLPVRYFRK